MYNQVLILVLSHNYTINPSIQIEGYPILTKINDVVHKNTIEIRALKKSSHTFFMTGFQIYFANAILSCFDVPSIMIFNASSIV